MLTENQKQAMAARLNSVKTEIAAAAVSCGRNPDDITLIGVSKFFPADYAKAAYEIGLADLGENRVQELISKIEQLELDGINPRWHLIGTLQKNKVKYIIGKTQLIHSVDSDGLIRELSRRSTVAKANTSILLQVNTSGEESKHGFGREDLIGGIRSWSELPGIEIRGLMTMAPIVKDPEETIPVFSRTRDLIFELQAMVPTMKLDILSMGMSQDYRQAIACGATHIRVGTAIFGPRG